MPTSLKLKPFFVDATLSLVDPLLGVCVYCEEKHDSNDINQCMDRLTWNSKIKTKDLYSRVHSSYTIHREDTSEKDAEHQLCTSVVHQLCISCAHRQQT